MFPQTSPFQQVAEASAQAAAAERERMIAAATDTPKPAPGLNLRRISDELDESLILLETGQLREHEEAVTRLDDLARELHELLDSSNGSTAGSRQ